ncbi:hypothetical protein OH791_33465 [Streptomyces anulatus]|uniref:hypothetical protein n=1 Tax=Streptomyces anulatus TaxID=1892 RepID=UPI003863EFA6|nr:hypothetical protein OH791_33465 [Streptomyces anulatus]
MSLTHPSGKHRADDRIDELAARVRELEAESESLTCELTRTLLRGMQDATALADQRTINQELIDRVEKLNARVIRDGAEKQRLRQAVINARPRITEVVQRLDRPYVSHVQVPYPVPVQPADTSNDETQAIPLIYLPESILRDDADAAA